MSSSLLHEFTREPNLHCMNTNVSKHSQLHLSFRCSLLGYVHQQSSTEQDDLSNFQNTGNLEHQIFCAKIEMQLKKSELMVISTFFKKSMPQNVPDSSRSLNNLIIPLML